MSQVFLKEKLATFRFVYGCNKFGLYPSFYFFLKCDQKNPHPLQKSSKNHLERGSKAQKTG